MKIQNPKFKIQGNIKLQASRMPGAISPLDYPAPDGRGWTLNEGPEAGDDSKRCFDLEERTAKFGEAIVRFCKKIPRDPGNDRLINQLVGCGTSIGANYQEASERISKKDFKHSISRCVKEAKETKFFLRMIATAE